MFSNGLEFWARQQRYTALLRQAERARLVGQTQTGRKGRGHLHCQALIWLGGALIVWGSRLRERHGVAVGTPVPECVNHAR
jgi:hypothetical protein